MKGQDKLFSHNRNDYDFNRFDYIIEEFIFDKFIKIDVITNCWNWLGCTNEKGYGLFKVGGRKGKALKCHRLSYERYIGKIPKELSVCHKCDNRRCVNPDHLFVATHQQNIKDRENKGRGFLKRGYKRSEVFIK